MSLRRSHNRCKRELIQHCLRVLGLGLGACRIIDFACGRGGDLNKLQGCRSYTGVDTACDALTELKRRAAEIGMPVTVHAGDATTLPRSTCDVAICHFALHYFCDSEAHCDALFSKIASCLVEGGVMCATYERVPGDDWDMAWGVPYHAVIGDCVDAMEWRVPWRRVHRIALKYGLAVVRNIPLRHMAADAGQNIWGFIAQRAQGQCCGRKPTWLPKPDSHGCRQGAGQGPCPPS